MKKVKVTVLKFAGQTGLLRPGSVVHVSAERAAILERAGIVEIVRKQEKKPRETNKVKTKRKQK